MRRHHLTDTVRFHHLLTDPPARHARPPLVDPVPALRRRSATAVAHSPPERKQAAPGGAVVRSNRRRLGGRANRSARCGVWTTRPVSPRHSAETASVGTGRCERQWTDFRRCAHRPAHTARSTTRIQSCVESACASG
jgi:hypothetical protein